MTVEYTQVPIGNEGVPAVEDQVTRQRVVVRGEHDQGATRSQAGQGRAHQRSGIEHVLHHIPHGDDVKELRVEAGILEAALPHFAVQAPGGQGGRVAGLEVMTMTPAIANQIRNNDVNRINDVIQTSRHLGMFRLDDHLLQLIQQGRVNPEDAMVHAQDPTALEDRIKSSGGAARSPTG